MQSCYYFGNKKLQETSVVADSLLQCGNDSAAYAMLADVDIDNVDIYGDAYALYCALLLQAQDRCDVELTDTVAISAYNYYSENTTDVYHAGLAYYYIGKVAANYRNDNLAIQFLEKSTELFLKVSSDRYTFLSLVAHAYIMLQCNHNHRALALLDKAMIYAKRMENPTYITSTYMRKACCYYNINNLDSVIALLETPSLIKDYDYYNLFSLYYDQMNKPKEAILYNDSLVSWSVEHNNDTIAALINRAYLLYRSGELTAAKSLAGDLESATIYEDVEKYRLLTDIAIDKCMNDDAHKYFKMFEASQDSILMGNSRNEEKNLTITIARLRDEKTSRIREKWQLISVFGVFFTLVITLLVVLYRKKQEENERKYKSVLLLLEQERIKYYEMKESLATQTTSTIDSQELESHKLFCDSIMYDIQQRKLPANDVTKHIISVVCKKYNGFDIQLKSKFPYVTDSDIALCCMIRIGLKRSFVADIMCISIDGLKSKIARLKKKMLATMCTESADWEEVWRFVTT